MSGTDLIASELASHLGPSLEPLGFKYVKSLRSFRRKSAYGHDLITLDVTRASDGSYRIAFTFQVRHDAIEKLRATFGTHTSSTMATIFQNSYNVHPNRPISYPGPTFWYRSPPIDWAELLPEVDRFLDAVILPWLAQFADCKNVRNALAANDGWAISLWPWEIVAAFDILAHREDDLIVYLSEQQKKALKWDPQWAAKFHSFVESISARLPPIPADPGRTEAAPEEKHRIEPPRLSVFPGDVACSRTGK